MAVKSFIECERRRLEKLKNLQLPHTFKKIGIGIFVISIVSLFVVAFTFNNHDIKQIAKYGILVGLLIVSISKEKIEDELVVELRMRSYSFAFICGVIYALALPFIDYLVDIFSSTKAPTIEWVGDFVILWILLMVQVLFFHALIRFHNEK